MILIDLPCFPSLATDEPCEVLRVRGCDRAKRTLPFQGRQPGSTRTHMRRKLLRSTREQRSCQPSKVDSSDSPCDAFNCTHTVSIPLYTQCVQSPTHSVHRGSRSARGRPCAPCAPCANAVIQSPERPPHPRTLADQRRSKRCVAPSSGSRACTSRPAPGRPTANAAPPWPRPRASSHADIRACP